MESGIVRIRAVFDRLRHVRRKALIPFVMGGDPNLETTSRLLLALSDAGADVLEVGLPFPFDESYLVRLIHQIEPQKDKAAQGRGDKGLGKGNPPL